MGEGRQKGGRCRCGGAPTCNVTPLVKYCVVNIYSPNNDDYELIENLFLETLGRSREDHLIMGGEIGIQFLRTI